MRGERNPFRMLDKSRLIPSLRRYVTFGGGSAIGAVFDYLVTLLAHDLLGFSAGAGLAIAMAVSASVVFVYHERITFGTAGTPWRARYLRFLMLAVLVLVLRVLVLEALIYLGVPVALAIAGAIVIVSVANFGASSMFIFLGAK